MSYHNKHLCDYNARTKKCRNYYHGRGCIQAGRLWLTWGSLGKGDLDRRRENTDRCITCRIGGGACWGAGKGLHPITGVTCFIV